ncbi:MAG: DUF4249 family protein [Bacteroidota bacterium]|nr:DUF4249 family protein [Bacteroidota bacterium]
MKRIKILIILVILISGCTTEVEINQPAYNRKVAVDGWIEAGDYARIYLTFSSPYLTQYDSASIRASFLNYAKVTLLNSRGDSEILTLFKDATYFPPFVYRSVSMKGEVGETYRLRIETLEHVITSSTTIPKIPTENRVFLDLKTDSSGIAKAEFSPDLQNVTYLYLQIKSLKADINFHPCLPQLFSMPPSASSCDVQLNRTYEGNILSTNKVAKFYDNWPLRQYALSDTLFVKIGSIDKQSFEVLNSIFTDQNNKNNPVAFNGNVLKTNIEGGIGHWTGVGLAPIQAIYSKK